MERAWWTQSAWYPICSLVADPAMAHEARETPRLVSSDDAHGWPARSVYQPSPRVTAWSTLNIRGRLPFMALTRGRATCGPVVRAFMTHHCYSCRQGLQVSRCIASDSLCYQGTRESPASTLGINEGTVLVVIAVEGIFLANELPQGREIDHCLGLQCTLKDPTHQLI